MSILKKDNWLDKDVDFMICDIIEYDMKRAGLSIIKEDKLLPEELIQKYEAMPKKEADKAIGKLQIKNTELKDGLKQGFRKYRLLFGELNDITDDDIVSVKKDAIFTKKYCEHTHVGEYITFVEKHEYQARLYLNGCEFYWKYDGGIDVKGIAEDKVQLHEDYMLNVIWKVIKHMGEYDYDGGIKYLVKFMDDYKFKRLPIAYYRELNQLSEYSFIFYDQPQTSIHLDEVYKSVVIGNYNYVNILTPLLSLLMK